MGDATDWARDREEEERHSRERKERRKKERDNEEFFKPRTKGENEGFLVDPQPNKEERERRLRDQLQTYGGQVNVPNVRTDVPPDERSMREMTALEKAGKLVYGDREESYGHPHLSMSTIGVFFNAYMESRIGFNPELTPEDISVLMMLVKVARLVNSDFKHEDSVVDTAGYVAVLERVMKKSRENKETEEELMKHIKTAFANGEQSVDVEGLRS